MTPPPSAPDEPSTPGPSDDEDLPFSEAIDELERILRELEGEDVDIDRLAGNVRRASELIARCRERIAGVEMEISQILDR